MDMDAYVFGEENPPSLVFPRQLRSSFDADEELALEVQQLIQVGEQQVQCVLSNNTALRECLCVFLDGARQVSILVPGAPRREGCQPA